MHPRTTGTIFKTLCIDYEFQYPASSQIYMDISYPGTSRSAGLNLEPNASNGTSIDVDIDPPSLYIELISIDPQEDDNYIYKPFSTYLKCDDNGEFGKNLYQYLDEFLPNAGADVSISEIPQIQEITIQLSTGSSNAVRFQEYARVKKNYDGGISFELNYILYKDGRVVKTSSTEPT